MNYTITYNNNNNNNNNNNTILIIIMDGFKSVLLLFEIPMGRRKNFLEIYRQFGHAPSERFASSSLIHRSPTFLCKGPHPLLCAGKIILRCHNAHYSVHTTPQFDSMQAQPSWNLLKLYQKPTVILLCNISLPRAPSLAIFGKTCACYSLNPFHARFIQMASVSTYKL